MAIRFVDTLSPDELTISDRIERADLQKTLSHYSDLWRQSEREKELKSFFSAFECADADPSWLAERENELQVTFDEWQVYLRTQAELANARYAASPF